MRSAQELRYEATEVFQPKQLVYFWTGRSWVPYGFVRYHDHCEAVRIRNGWGEAIVNRWELISESRYLAEKQREAKEQARERYAEIIRHWSCGLRKSKEIGALIGETPRATGQMIATAIEWGFLVDDRKKPKHEESPVDQSD